MKRGDVVIAATGSGFGREPRPWVVIQSDNHPAKLVILLGITTLLDEGFALRPRLEPSPTNGLKKTSDIMVDIPVVAARDQVVGVAGRLDSREMSEVETALLIILGLVTD